MDTQVARCQTAVKHWFCYFYVNILAMRNIILF